MKGRVHVCCRMRVRYNFHWFVVRLDDHLSPNQATSCLLGPVALLIWWKGRRLASEYRLIELRLRAIGSISRDRIGVPHNFTWLDIDPYRFAIPLASCAKFRTVSGLFALRVGGYADPGHAIVGSLDGISVSLKSRSIGRLNALTSFHEEQGTHAFQSG